MKRFWYKFLVCILSLGMLYPTWIATGTQKAKAAAAGSGGAVTGGLTVNGTTTPFPLNPFMITSNVAGDITDSGIDDVIISIVDNTVANLRFDTTANSVEASVVPSGSSLVVVSPITPTADQITINATNNSGAGESLIVSKIKIIASSGPTPDFVGTARLKAVTAGGTVYGDIINVDAQNPEITSAETADLDMDGKLDAVKINFSKNIDDSTVVSGDFDVLGYSGELFSSTTNGDLANNNYIYLTFTESGMPDTEATPNLSYVAGLLADLVGNLMGSQSVLSIDKAAPAKPTNLNKTINGGQVNLFWDSSVSASDVSGYNIYRSSSPEVLIGSTSGTTYSNTPGYGIFTYYVSAVDAAGNESAKSNKITADLSQLPAPTNLVATPGDNEVVLSWDAVSGADHYNVYYKKSSSATWIGPVGVLSNGTKIVGLENGVKYDFIVRAVGANGFESVDAVVGAIIKSAEIVLASTPTVETVVTQPETPSTPEVIPPAEKEEQEVGQIKGEEAAVIEEEDINWTPWIILFVLIVLAGAATGGYFYWFGNEEEEIVSEKVIEKTRKPNGKKGSAKKPTTKKNKRW
jgi:fibronectin type 3 domain-containing protein